MAKGCGGGGGGGGNYFGQCFSFLSLVVKSVNVFLCSMGLLYDQLPYTDCNGWPSCKRQDLRVQEINPLPQLDWSAYKRFLCIFVQGWLQPFVWNNKLFPFLCMVGTREMHASGWGRWRSDSSNPGRLIISIRSFCPLISVQRLKIQ